MSDLLALLLPALAQALLHFLWQGVLIGAGAAAALRALRGARAQARYAAACVALLACLIVPFATMLVQLASAAAAADGALSLVAPRVSGVASAAVASAAATAGAQTWIVLFWALGASVVAARMAFGIGWLRGLPQCGDAVLGAEWQRRLDALVQCAGVRRQVVLRLVDGLDTPATFGAWRPVILLPVALVSRLPLDLVEALLAHELAHIRRHDYLVNLVQVAIEALLFYHPVVWWLSRRIRREREEVADTLAAGCDCPPRRLAFALSALAEWQAGQGAPRLAQAARGGDLLRRIERLLAPTPRTRPAARHALALLGLAAVCIASLAYAQTALDAGEPTSSSKESASPARTARDTYVLVHAGRAWTWGPRDSADAEALALGVEGNFFFAHRTGGFFVVTDAALVERVQASWRELERLEHEFATLEAAYRTALEAPDTIALEAQRRGASPRALALRLDALQRAQERAGERIARESRDVLDAALSSGAARPAVPRVASLR